MTRDGGTEPRSPTSRPGLLPRRRRQMTATNSLTASPEISLEAVLARLLQAKAQDIVEIVAPLPERQRAQLAVFCYSRAHLHDIGLAVGATCELPALVNASPSTAAGTALYELSRSERPRETERVVSSSRSRITLAKSASGNSALATIIASIASDEAAEPQPA